MALGRTEAGRYLAVPFILKTTDEDVFSTLAEIAKKEGVSTDELIDTWLKDRIVQAKH